MVGEGPLPLSGLQRLVFCERQAALIHVERAWADNALTVDGSHRHRTVHETLPRRERRGDLLIVRGMLLESGRLGVVGVADVVEFHRSASGRDGCGPRLVRLPGLEGCWRPFPVEYKRGRPKPHRADEVQLCAQAICLEEMLDVRIEAGALFYGKVQRRMEVVMDEALRRLTFDAAQRLHELVTRGITPPADPKPECRSCSMVEVCMPAVGGRQRSVRRYVRAALARADMPEAR